MWCCFGRASTPSLKRTETPNNAQLASPKIVARQSREPKKILRNLSRLPIHDQHQQLPSGQQPQKQCDTIDSHAHSRNEACLMQVGVSTSPLIHEGEPTPRPSQQSLRDDEYLSRDEGDNKTVSNTAVTVEAKAEFGPNELDRRREAATGSKTQSTPKLQASWNINDLDPANLPKGSHSSCLQTPKGPPDSLPSRRRTVQLEYANVDFLSSLPPPPERP
jgi:hypothetical protein